MRITESELVEAPASDVWAVVTDLGSHPRWRPALREFRQVSEGPSGGTRIHEVIAWRGREIVLADEVTALEPERRLAVRGGWKARTSIWTCSSNRGAVDVRDLRLVAPSEDADHAPRGAVPARHDAPVDPRGGGGAQGYVERGPEALAARPGHASPG